MTRPLQLPPQRCEAPGGAEGSNASESLSTTKRCSPSRAPCVIRARAGPGRDRGARLRAGHCSTSSGSGPSRAGACGPGSASGGSPSGSCSRGRCRGPCACHHPRHGAGAAGGAGGQPAVCGAAGRRGPGGHPRGPGSAPAHPPAAAPALPCRTRPRGGRRRRRVRGQPQAPARRRRCVPAARVHAVVSLCRVESHLRSGGACDRSALCWPRCWRCAQAATAATTTTARAAAAARASPSATCTPRRRRRRSSARPPPPLRVRAPFLPLCALDGA